MGRHAVAPPADAVAKDEARHQLQAHRDERSRVLAQELRREPVLGALGLVVLFCLLLAATWVVVSTTGVVAP